MRLGVVVIGYNRVDSLQRLLEKLQLCEYWNDEVTLIISIDRWESDEVEKCAEAFVWNAGTKIIKTFQERQGLKKHILKCGSYMDEYNLNAIAVFEDDVMPSVDFYCFMKQAVSFYEDEERIAGIGLYSYQWHPIANKPFVPMQGKGSVYLNRFAVSWGQIWIRKQWNAFIKWMEKTDEEKIDQIDIPTAVKAWKNSWLKYHIAYCCDQQKYFVYPYRALTTYYAARGEHTDTQSYRYQVPLVEETGTQYDFFPVDQINVRYDSYFESEYLFKHLAQKGYDTNIDLYGLKGEDKGKTYWLTVEEKPYEKTKSYGLVLKPHEENIICDIEGEEIYLYDRNSFCKKMKKTSFNMNKFIYYFNGSISKQYWYSRIKRAFGKGK